MHELQRNGRYFLYAVLLFFALAFTQHHPGLHAAIAVALVLGVPGYWFWTWALHKRDHQDHAVYSCSHCRDRFDIQNEQLHREQREQEMNRLIQRD